MVIFFLLFNQIEENYNYLQEEIFFLKENPITKIKDIEIVPYLDEITIKNIIEKDSIGEIEQKIKPFIKISEEKKPRLYYSLYFKDKRLRQRIKYFSSFEYHWEGRDSTIIHYLKFNIKNLNFYLGDFLFSRSLSLIFSHPNYLPIEEYKNLYKKEISPATSYSKNKSFTGLFFNYKNFSLLTSDKVFGIFNNIIIKDFKNEINLFYFLKEKLGISYFFKKHFLNSSFSSEIGFTNKKEYGITFSIFYRWEFFTYNLHFGYLNKNLSNYTYYQKRDFPYFDTDLKTDINNFILQVKYLSFFNYEYDSFPHNLSFIIKRKENDFSWQIKLRRYLKLTRINRWSNSFLINKNLKDISLSLFLSDNYYENKRLKRKYLISPRINIRVKNLEIILAYYLNYFNQDFKIDNFEEEILAEHSLEENIRKRFVSQINCNFKNFLLKLKFSFDKEISYLTYLSIKI